MDKKLNFNTPSKEEIVYESEEQYTQEKVKDVKLTTGRYVQVTEMDVDGLELLTPFMDEINPNKLDTTKMPMIAKTILPKAVIKPKMVASPEEDGFYVGKLTSDDLNRIFEAIWSVSEEMLEKAKNFRLQNLES